MSYFRAQIGRRPAPDTAPEERKRPEGDKGWEPYFAARIGPRASDAGKERRTDPAGPEPQLPVCPLCHGALAQDGGLLRCTARCGARWLAEASGHLVDLAALPFGICRCCPAPQALVRGEQGAICPASGAAYLLLPDGSAVLAADAREGVCQCCAPPLPLVRREGALVCLARPDQQYQRSGDRITLISNTRSAPASAEMLEEIDLALRRNNARLTVHGLFDLD